MYSIVLIAPRVGKSLIVPSGMTDHRRPQVVDRYARHWLGKWISVYSMWCDRKPRCTYLIFTLASYFPPIPTCAGVLSLSLRDGE
ncbi:hypothetical protein BC832DRAFT_244214 [Gaertneriomyces semiglobifer]|nr:hypothetical protein BC832DRAFT_244214 [Gaertneriomyces semiglobifer]